MAIAERERQILETIRQLTACSLLEGIDPQARARLERRYGQGNPFEIDEHPRNLFDSCLKTRPGKERRNRYSPAIDKPDERLNRSGHRFPTCDGGDSGIDPRGSSVDLSSAPPSASPGRDGLAGLIQPANPSTLRVFPLCRHRSRLFGAGGIRHLLALTDGPRHIAQQFMRDQHSALRFLLLLLHGSSPPFVLQSPS